jgi:hypothetical protein
VVAHDRPDVGAQHDESELPARQGLLEADVAVAGDEDLEAVVLGRGQQRAVGQSAGFCQSSRQT